jgi:hypothetical protein
MHCDRLQHSMKLILIWSYTTTKIEKKNKRHRDLERKDNETIMPIIQGKVLFFIKDQVNGYV